MCAIYKSQVEELESLFGEGDRTTGRARIETICGVGSSSISMWKKNGVPDFNRGLLFAAAMKYGLAVPEWLIIYEGPATLFELSRKKVPA